MENNEAGVCVIYGTQEEGRGGRKNAREDDVKKRRRRNIKMKRKRKTKKRKRERD